MRFRHALALMLASCSLVLVVATSAGTAVSAEAVPGSVPPSAVGSGVPAAADPSTSVSATPAAPGGSLSASSTAATLTPEARLAAVSQAIVAMTGGNKRTGSGIVIAPNRVLTSTRVLKHDDPTARIMTLDGTLHTFTVVARDEQLGLALLQASLATVKPFPGWGDSNVLKAGEAVSALGIQSGVREVLTLPGAISSPAAATPGGLILTDIRLDPLIEGGALITPDGRLVGITTAKSQSPEVGELGWAVTSDAARGFLGGIERQRQAAEEEALVTVIRRWVARSVLAVFALLFGLFGWWFRRWYKRMEQREMALEAEAALAAEAAE